MQDKAKHKVVGKVLLIACLLFSMTIIGENSSYVSAKDRDSRFELDTCRKSNNIRLRRLEGKLNQYELSKKLPDR